MNEQTITQSLQKDALHLDELVLEAFLKKPRRVPTRPGASRTSTLVVRKEIVPFYYAIYDHDLGRFTALQYRPTKDAPLRSVALAPEKQPTE